MSSEAIKRLASPSAAMKALKWRNKIMADIICPFLQDLVSRLMKTTGMSSVKLKY